MNDSSSISLNAVWDEETQGVSILVVRVVHNFVVVFDKYRVEEKRKDPQSKYPPLTLPRLCLTQSCPQQTLRLKCRI